MAPITKKLSYQNVDKEIKELFKIPYDIPNVK